MKTFLPILLALSTQIFAGDPLQDLANITAIQANQNAVKKQDYDGPSPFTTPWIRNYFAGSGQSLDPNLAAALERRLSPCGPPTRTKITSHSLGPFRLVKGEFSGRTVDDAVATIRAQFESQGSTQTVQGSSGQLTTATSASFWAEKAKQKSQAPQSASVSQAKLLAVDASNGLPYEVTPANLDAVLQNESSMAKEDFDAAVKSSHARVAEAFPAYLDEKSPIHAKADKVYDDCTKAHSKVVSVSDCPWIVYSVAARQLGIKPALQ